MMNRLFKLALLAAFATTGHPVWAGQFCDNVSCSWPELFSQGTSTNGAALFKDGNIATYSSGILTQLNGQLINMGINDAMFGPQVNAYQGGFVRFDTRAGPFFSIYTRPSGSTVSSAVFSVDALGNATATSKMTAQSYSVGATAGFSGTKTAGACVLAITGGIITNVTGC